MDASGKAQPSFNAHRMGSSDVLKAQPSESREVPPPHGQVTRVTVPCLLWTPTFRPTERSAGLNYSTLQRGCVQKVGSQSLQRRDHEQVHRGLFPVPPAQTAEEAQLTPVVQEGGLGG